MHLKNNNVHNQRKTHTKIYIHMHTCITHTHTHREREREGGRETDRQTDRQTESERSQKRVYGLISTKKTNTLTSKQRISTYFLKEGQKDTTIMII